MSGAIVASLLVLAVTSSATTGSAATGSAVRGPVAELTAVPAQGVAGSMLSLAGSGLPARQRATVFLGRRRLTRFRADRHGKWAIRTRIPSRAAAGDPRLAVVVARTRVVVARFAVTRAAAGSSSLVALSNGESVRLSPTDAIAGSSVGLHATGFPHHAVIRVWLARTRLATWRVNGRGVMRGNVRVPSNTRTGAYVLSIRPRGHRLGLRLAVTPPPPPQAIIGTANPTVDAVGDMACAQTDPNYNHGIGTPNAVFPMSNCLQKYVSDLLVSPLPNALLDLGDNQYNKGELTNYNTVYNPTFGRANSVVYPSIGNAEYYTPGASGFFNYFTNSGVFARIQAGIGDSSHLAAAGYYSFNLGAWHIIALNANCTIVSCAAGSSQEQWLKADLAAHSQNNCTLAFWHQPRWNSGGLGNDSSTAAFWTDLYAAHADLVLNGHGNHHYERFLPQDPNGNPNSHGIQEFIVSTGGQSHGSPPPPPVPPAKPLDYKTSVVRSYDTYGMLALTLHPTGYDYHFVPASDAADGVTPPAGTFTDSGSRNCV